MSADFLDTNVFIYHIDDTDPRKHAIARRLVEAGLTDGSACISFQVVQECLNVGLRKAEKRMSAPLAQAYLDAVLAPLWRVMPGAALYRHGIELQERYRFGFYDSLIIAAALEAGCTRLYSEDLQHGQRIGKLTIQNPFLDGGA
ncbi:MAG TPA: PIN domain-containing protein [Rhodocyclaceae bacterium]|nr:PIN domain-containing protein [Rhodocyclaceae bacterium]